MICRSFVIALLAGFVSCSTSDPASFLVSFPRNDDQPIQIAVQVADSAEEREHGLMGVTELPADSGMAFVWDEPTTGTFWMKNTLIPLSIAFVGPDGRIVTIRDMEPCTTDACPKFGATAPYTLAIEVNAGFFDRKGIEVGDRAELGTGLAS